MTHPIYLSIIGDNSNRQIIIYNHTRSFVKCLSHINARGETKNTCENKRIFIEKDDH